MPVGHLKKVSSEIIWLEDKKESEDDKMIYKKEN